MRIYVVDHSYTQDYDGTRFEANVELWPEHTNDIFEYEKLMKDCGCGPFGLDRFRKLFNIKPREFILPAIKNVYFNPPATVVLWDDGTKTVIKCQDGDTYSKETGLALCLAKKAMGNSSRQFNDIFKKWIPEEKVDLSYRGDCTSCKYCDLSEDEYPCHNCMLTNWEPAK